MSFEIKKATRKQLRLKLSLTGPPGAGKSYTALRLAHHLSDRRVCVIDTEAGNSQKYAGEVDADGARFDFDLIELQSFSPDDYIAAVRQAEASGRYDTVVIDTLSHEWFGKGGALEMADQARLRSRSDNGYFAWKDVTPKHNEMIEAMLRSRLHVIATLRSKVAYALEEYLDDGRAKTRPVKVGLAPITREGVEYEFDITGVLDMQHNLIVDKTRCSALAGQVYAKAGRELALALKAWLSQGEAETPEEALRSEIRALAKSLGYRGDHMRPLITKLTRVDGTLDALDLKQLDKVKRRLVDDRAEREQSESF